MVNSMHAPSPDSGDAQWIAEAIDLAGRNVAEGGGPFGALIVKDDALVATGVNRVTRDNDPTAHAEVVAIRDAARRLETFVLAGCTLYTSCEPCPMCMASALWSRVDRIVYAADRHDAADAGFDDLAFYELFARPRDGWSTRVEELRVDTRLHPFDAWRASPTRVEY